MARIIVACALLALAGAVRTDFNDSLSDVDVHRFLEEQALGRGACGAEVANPGSGLVEYFDGMRVEMGLLDSIGQPDAGLPDPAKCSKKDVCLLMRQLDMDFYERAREGKLMTSDYNTIPPAHVVKSGNCATANRGYKLRPITSGKRCKRVAKAHNIPVPARGTKLERLTVGDPLKPLPEGCIVVQGKVILNNVGVPTAKAGLTYVDRAKKEVWQLCEMDRSLTESAAAYYSPYKLKENMVGREAYSTSCSFGMYALLARLKLTNSHCARILTFKTSNKFKSAAEAVELAKSFATSNPTASQTIMNYVESVRQKFVLMNVVAGDWCPGVWTTAQATGGSTCAAARTMAWTAEAKELGQAKSAVNKDKQSHARKFGPSKYAGNQELLDALDAVLAGLSEEDGRSSKLAESKDNPPEFSSSSDRPDKIALTAQACEAIDDASLSEALKGAPEAPPDFFRAAALEEDEE